MGGDDESGMDQAVQVAGRLLNDIAHLLVQVFIYGFDKMILR